MYDNDYIYDLLCTSICLSNLCVLVHLILEGRFYYYFQLLELLNAFSKAFSPRLYVFFEGGTGGLNS